MKVGSLRDSSRGRCGGLGMFAECQRTGYLDGSTMVNWRMEPEGLEERIKSHKDMLARHLRKCNISTNDFEQLACNRSEWRTEYVQERKYTHKIITNMLRISEHTVTSHHEKGSAIIV